MSDATRYSLIGRAQEGQENAWSELWQVYGDYVRYRLRTAGVRDSDLEDVTQDVFLKVSTSLAGFEPKREVGSFRAWLKLVVRQRAADHFRKTGRTPGGVATASSGVFRAVAAEDPDEDDVSEIVALYERALALAEKDFTPDTVAAFRMTVIEGLSSEEAGRRLGKNAPAVRMNKKRVLQRLREVLGE